VNAPRLNLSQTDRYTRFTHPGEMDSWVDLGVGYVPRWFTCLPIVTHPFDSFGSRTNDLAVASPTPTVRLPSYLVITLLSTSLMQCMLLYGVHVNFRSSEAGDQSARHTDQDRSLGLHLHLHGLRLPTAGWLDYRSNYSLARTRTRAHHRHQRKVACALALRSWFCLVYHNKK